jgi:hypothetical protein
MPLLEAVGLRSPQPQPKPVAEVPAKVKGRLDRGRKAMLKDAAIRRMCVRFERGETYWFIGARGQLSQQSTVTDLTTRDGKPPHRVRNKYNFIRPIVTAKVSASSQATPGFEVVPSTTDSARIGAARLAEKISLSGYDKWHLHSVDMDCSYNAIGGGGEGFAVPYFDPNVGPYTQKIDDETGEPLVDDAGQPVMIGEGEIKVIALCGNEVYWEPGQDFMDSRWHAIERAVPMEDIEEMPGFFGKPLKADAATSDIPTDVRPDNMAMKTEYFERPCPKYPEGRHLVIANGRQVVPERRYPLRNRKGVVIDEPVPHRLAWDIGGGKQRDFGLTWQLADAQRTAQDARNKAVEWKNRSLMPQWKAKTGSITTRPTDEPGSIMYYKGDEAPEQEIPQPIPDSLFKIADVAKDDMREIGFSTQLDAGPNVAARTVQAVVEQSALQWAQFLVSKADWWSRLMRHCLVLASCHYSEPRLMTFRGRDGWEHVQDFEGAQLMDEVDVRVFPHSLVSLTRDGVRDQLDWIATRFPGFLSPQEALAALQAGSIDRISQSYWLDVARANNAVQKIRDGSSMDMPVGGSSNPLTGQPEIGEDGQPVGIPMWMPGEQDNLQIWERVFGDWMKTDDYAAQTPEAQEQGRLVWNAIQALKTVKAQREAQQQNAMAEQLGMKNAAKPGDVKPLPDLPGPASQQ